MLSGKDPQNFIKKCNRGQLGAGCQAFVELIRTYNIYIPIYSSIYLLYIICPYKFRKQLATRPQLTPIVFELR